MVPVGPVERQRVQVATSMWRDMALGLQYARRDATVWAVLVITIYMNMLLFPYMGLMSVFAEQVLNVGPVGLGQMGALNGVGAGLGLIALSPMRHGSVQARAFAIGSLLGCVAIGLF